MDKKIEGLFEEINLELRYACSSSNFGDYPEIWNVARLVTQLKNELTRQHDAKIRRNLKND